jgi:signal transduction histidine kinase
VVVGIALAAGALALVTLLKDGLTDEVRNAARLRAADVVSALEAGAAPESLALDDGEDQVVQVLDDRGRVVAAGPQVAGMPPLANLQGGESVVAVLPLDEDPYLVYAAAAPAHRRVLVARTVETVVEATAEVRTLLAVGVPVVLAVVGLTTWWLVGRALRPVEAIRREVAEISASAMHRRVPDPPGGDEIARLARTMNRMLGRLEDAQRRQRRFVSDASHELRSPIAVIRQHAEVALAHPDRTSTPDLAGAVLAEDLRVQRLVEDLLLLARSDEQTLRLRRRPVDLDDLVFAEARRLRGNGLVVDGLRVDSSGVGAARVSGDPAALARVLRNLGSNAARHAAGLVAFSLAHRDGVAVLAVSDDGPGIPPADRERVFERFVRLDEARARDAGGSGLGLAIVRELVCAHGGTVTIADRTGGGAQVEVAVPLVSSGSASGPLQ